MSKAILILGATGKQGGAVLRSLLAHPRYSPDEYTIFAATRDPNSAKAQKLSALSKSVHPIMGDLRKPKETFANLLSSSSAKKLWAAFIVTNPGKTETEDGITAVDEAIQAGVSHIVFSSVDRGAGNPPTEVPHFITKHDIEQHLIGKAKKASSSSSNEKSLSYTIIRPPFFLDNLDPKAGFFSKVTTTLWRDRIGPKLTVVDTVDIGNFGASAILEHDSKTYHNAEINVAGDVLSFKEANETYKKKLGHDMPTTYGFFVSLLLFLSHDFKLMVEFFNHTGFAASVPKSNEMHHMANFEEWVDRTHASKSE